MDSAELKTVLDQITHFSSYIFFSRSTLYLVLFICIYNLFCIRKTNIFVYSANLIVLLGSFIYFVLWAPLMGVHDYYYNAILILIPAITLPFIWHLKTNHTKIFNNSILKILFSIFVIYNLIYCVSFVQLKGHNHFANHSFIDNPTLLNEMEWYNWNNTSNLYRLTKIEPELKRLNIGQKDKVVVFPDESFNTTLYLIDRKGWTNFMNYSNTNDINDLIKKGAKYLFILDDSFLSKDFLKPFLSQQIGEFEGVKIFKLKNAHVDL